MWHTVQGMVMGIFILLTSICDWFKRSCCLIGQVALESYHCHYQIKGSYAAAQHGSCLCSFEWAQNGAVCFCACHCALVLASSMTFRLPAALILG